MAFGRIHKCGEFLSIFDFRMGFYGMIRDVEIILCCTLLVAYIISTRVLEIFSSFYFTIFVFGMFLLHYF